MNWFSLAVHKVQEVKLLIVSVLHVELHECERESLFELTLLFIRLDYLDQYLISVEVKNSFKINCTYQGVMFHKFV